MEFEFGHYNHNCYIGILKDKLQRHNKTTTAFANLYDLLSISRKYQLTDATKHHNEYRQLSMASMSNGIDV